jgi:asparagine synthase (glutamine-hydrolysing)
VIVYNGEIYNYQELIPELVALGHVFRTRSDTEVIVHAWETWGAACVERLRGMFAFALWDEARQTLFLARDRLGVKPLYYAELSDGQWIFASELKGLLAHGALSREIDPCAVEDYFAFGYVPEPGTVFSAARKLEPGHTLLLRRGETPAAPQRYWDVRFTGSSPISLADAQAELVHRLEESVRLRMIS